MSNDRDPFSRFENLTAKQRFEEFNKRFDEIRSKFPSTTRTMFDQHQQQQQQQQQHQNSSKWNQNNQNHESMEHKIDDTRPIQSQSQTSFPHHHHLPHDSFFPEHLRKHFSQDDVPSSMFRSRFNNVFSSELGQNANDSQGHHRVHHIPIQIEPRPNSREHSPRIDRQQQQAEIPICNNQQIPINEIHQPNRNVASPNVTIRNVSPSPQTNVPEDFHPKTSPRVFAVPIEIEKKPNIAETNEKKINIPIQTLQPGSQQLGANQVMPSSEPSPSIADPNIVYPMQYSPLIKTENKEEKNSAFALPKVVPLAYEPQIISKTANTVASEMQDALNQSNTSGDDSTIQQEQQQCPNKQENPFDYIDEILNDLRNWEQQVNECQATSDDDKGYRWLDEMLTLCVLRLDCINIDGNEELRKYRKQAVNEVSRVASLLESKIKKPSSKDVQADNQTSNIEQCSDRQLVLSVVNKDNSIKNENESKMDENNPEQHQQQDKNKKDGKRFLFFKKKNNLPKNHPSNENLDRNNNDLKLEGDSSAEHQQQPQQNLSGKMDQIVESNNDEKEKCAKTTTAKETEV
ncbi:hypothetical protein SSS_08463 [Sarcoptes scabiei]|uniref:BAG domain-containing protein n=2 Tax=Sarcoptes scabiei TaxID=52283 RepID=A0A834R957_SARSC|nr:hypothetical protein SSS_08463 [Sarcoptes scabiei]